MSHTLPEAPEDLTKVDFDDIPVGGEFHFSAYEGSGLLADLGRPGRKVYRKISARRYVWVEDEDTVYSVGSIRAKAWR